MSFILLSLSKCKYVHMDRKRYNIVKPRENENHVPVQLKFKNSLFILKMKFAVHENYIKPIVLLLFFIPTSKSTLSESYFI